MKDLISWYNTLFGIIGFIGSTVSIKTYLRDNKLNVNNLNIFNTVALKQDFFTNRINEIKMILELLNNNNKVISVYGNKGVGKSEFLKIITDYINNNIKSNKLNDTFIKNDIKRDKYHILKNYKA
ncbi:KAP family NTPase, partial [Aliarcobacter cryaerophilus]|uniref:P-loop NTPase fold protein n=2 Tax=Aliarcobacter cryaerophilus TaxID=28198 RepID=UPI003DA61431